MSDTNKPRAEEAANNKEELNNPELQGTKAIEADKVFNKQGKAGDQKNKKKCRMLNNGVTKGSRQFNTSISKYRHEIFIFT
jgi:hypothetical protein